MTYQCEPWYAQIVVASCPVNSEKFQAFQYCSYLKSFCLGCAGHPSSFSRHLPPHCFQEPFIIFQRSCNLSQPQIHCSKSLGKPHVLWSSICFNRRFLVDVYLARILFQAFSSIGGTTKYCVPKRLVPFFFQSRLIWKRQGYKLPQRTPLHPKN